MAFKLPTMTRETSSTTLTGDMVMAGAQSGYFAFSAGLSNGDTTFLTFKMGSDTEEGLYTYNSGANSFTRTTIYRSTNANAAVSWAAGTKDVICGLPGPSNIDAAGLILLRTILGVNFYDAAMSLSDAQQTQTRSNISAAQLAAMAAHNVVVNGAVDVSQFGGTSGATLTNNTSSYIADTWEAMYNHAAATAVVTSAQVTSASFGATIAGFRFAHQVKATTAITSPANGDFAKHRVKIEGYRIAHWDWGASGAGTTPIVVAFDLFSTASGVAFVKLSNNDQSRCYYHEITVSAGLNFFAFSVPADNAGTWQATTGVGLTFEVFVSGKETTPASSLDAWGATNKVQTTNSTNLLGTNNNLTQLTGLYIDIGSQLPVQADLPRLMRPFPEALWECQRFYEKSFLYGTAPNAAVGADTGNYEFVSTAAGTATQRSAKVSFRRDKPGTPTVTLLSPVAGSNEVYDATAAASCTSSSALSISESGFRIACAGNASTAINNRLIAHWFADGRL